MFGEKTEYKKSRETVPLRDCLTGIKVGIAIYQSKALFKGYCWPSFNFNFIKGILHNQQKKIQHMNDPTILVGLHNSRRSNHNLWVYFLSENILIKHYSVVGTAEPRIGLLRFSNFLRQPHIDKLHSKEGLVI